MGRTQVDRAGNGQKSRVGVLDVQRMVRGTEGHAGHNAPATNRGNPEVRETQTDQVHKIPASQREIGWVTGPFGLTQIQVVTLTCDADLILTVERLVAKLEAAETEAHEWRGKWLAEQSSRMRAESIIASRYRS